MTSIPELLRAVKAASASSCVATSSSRHSCVSSYGSTLTSIPASIASSDMSRPEIGALVRQRRLEVSEGLAALSPARCTSDGQVLRPGAPVA